MPSSDPTEEATIGDWVSDLGALLAETYGLDALDSTALIDSLLESLGSVRLVLRPDALSAPGRVQSQVERGATLSRIAVAPMLGEALRSVAAAGQTPTLISEETWARMFVDKLRMTYRIPPLEALQMVGTVAAVLRSYRIGERPALIVTRSVGKDLGLDRR